MPRHELVGLSYRRHHVLTVDHARWDIQAECQLRGKAAPPTPDHRIRFTLELSSLHADWQTAIARARRLEPALIDGIPARIELQTVELHFSTYVEQTEPHGDAIFVAIVDKPAPFPRTLDDPEFVKALAQAGNLAGNLLIQADEIEVSERYWIFPIQNIGANGVIVDRSNGRAFMTAGSMARSTWIWAYEHRLLEEPSGDVVIEQISDPDRAFAALRRFARIRREDLATLPLVLHGCASWMAAAELKEAETALRWRVAPRVG
ncbi:MAG: hypothetical protein H0T46_13120 [Deltaproteobacteria bacterium]|nr:hypothetical protein [Deltaproteobacteria bacterium]